MRAALSGLLALALCLAAGLACAQAGGGGPGGPLSPPADSAQAIDQVQGIVDAFTGGIAILASGTTATAAALRALGLRIALCLFGVLLAWSLIKGWVLGKGVQQVLPDLIQPLLVLGLSVGAVDGLGPAIEASVLAIGNVVAGALGVGHALNETGLLTTMGVSGLELLMTPVAHGLHPLDWIVGKAACLVAAVILLLCGVIGAGTLIVAKFQTAIALLLAPVVVPWAMWSPSAFVFNAWLGFLLAGAMTQTMVTIVAAMTSLAIERLSAVVAGYAGQEVSLVAFGALFLGAALIGYLFLSVPRLSSSLVAGTSLGIERWSAVAATVGRGLGITGASTQAGLRLGVRAGVAGAAVGARAGAIGVAVGARAGDSGAAAMSAARGARRSGAGVAAATAAGVRAGVQRWRSADRNKDTPTHPDAARTRGDRAATRSEPPGPARLPDGTGRRRRRAPARQSSKRARAPPRARGARQRGQS